MDVWSLLTEILIVPCLRAKGKNGFFQSEGVAICGELLLCQEMLSGVSCTLLSVIHVPAHVLM